MPAWEFWIDVGGTFTDCLARTPDDELIPFKLLSTGITKGRVEAFPDDGRPLRHFRDSGRTSDPAGFWTGYDLRLLDERGDPIHTLTVAGFEVENGTFSFDEPLPDDVNVGTRYELASGEEAPVVAIRYLLGLRLDEPIPEISVRLGTTRGTNALLTRNGARTAFVTTRGFGDVLSISNQDRPRLFELAVRKPQPLFERVVEIDERIDTDGNVLQRPDEDRIHEQLADVKASGIESIGVCLLHAYLNSAHEQTVERIAREAGFEEVSVSSRLSPLIKIVSRGDTTVMDAYLNPVLREYVGRLRASLHNGRARLPPSRDSGNRAANSAQQELRPPGAGESDLKLMTSAGGLVDADRFVGKDSFLSGPAGGVVGFSRVAQRAGFEKAIGFDMGGTSTDVSRFDGSYELEFEATKAGVRVVAPMLAIETVAAGGGSICGFDGVKLTVGPQSSGAEPGPACYGRGGPLSVTDVNLSLGRILPSHFPFPLDREAVEQQLTALCDEIAESPMGRRYTPVELADGFRQIANANMVRAIRKISVAKGYDPADYVLVTFGGAGAQHACAMARELGIARILVHPFAGILSAYGLGLADVRRFREQAVLQPYSQQTLDELEPLFRDLEARATDEVRAEGIPPDRIQPPVRSLDMRYQGLETTINVPAPEDGDYARRYEELHRQLYGYTRSGRAIEITAARVEVVGRTADPPVQTVAPVRRRPEPAETTRTWFDGEEHETGVFLRDDLHPGDELDGPAVVCEANSTVVVDPGFSTSITERGEMLIQESGVRGQESGTDESRKPVGCDAETSLPEDGAETPGTQYSVRSTDHAHEVHRSSSAASPSPSGSHDSSLVTHHSSLNTSSAADPVLLEIFNNLFASIAEQMGVTLQQTSVSTNVKERLDFSCAIFSPTGDLVVNAPHIPVHLGAMGETVKRILADNPQMAPGDVYVTNDPYRGGSHLPDVTVVTPVHHSATGELLFFTAGRAHHAEIGGIVPGSMPPFSKNLAEEGVLIRNFKLVEAGESREADFEELLRSGPYPSRSVQDNLADAAAQVAANNRGVHLLHELVDRYTLPVVQAYMGHIQRAAAEKMRMALGRIPDGSYSLTDHLDDGSPIAATITIEGDSARVDFTGTGPVMDSNLNANRAIVTAAVLYVFRCLIAEDIPLNAGVLDPVEIVLPECLLNPPEREDPSQCAAVVGGNVETSQRVVDVLLGALQVAAASQGTMNNLTFGDETFGYYETIGGGNGATPEAPGADAVHTHMTNTRLTDAEVIERRYPVRLRRFAVRRGSGGNGAQRGGDGIVRELEFLRPLKLSILSERRGPYPPFGLKGGEPGTLGRNLLRRAGSRETEDLGGKVAVDVAPGDVLIIETPGGGGYAESPAGNGCRTDDYERVSGIES